MCMYKTEDGKCKRLSDDKTTSYCVDAPCKFEKLSNYGKDIHVPTTDGGKTDGTIHNVWLYWP